MSYKAGQKLLFGVAINDTDEPVMSSKGGVRWVCPKYARWYDMLRRTVGKHVTPKNQVYSNTGVSEDWLKFSFFKSWMSSQDFVGKHLDKDILGDGSLYSAQTCCFIEPDVNAFIAGMNTPVERLYGVSLRKDLNKYRALVTYKENRFLGQLRDNKYVARMDYLEEKLKFFSQVVDEFSLEDNIANAVIEKYQKAYDEAVLYSLKGE